MAKPKLIYDNEREFALQYLAPLSIGDTVYLVDDEGLLVTSPTGAPPRGVQYKVTEIDKTGQLRLECASGVVYRSPADVMRLHALDGTDPWLLGLRETMRVRQPGAQNAPAHVNINAENLDGMKVILDHSVDCIYIDPPYSNEITSCAYFNCYGDYWCGFMKKRLDECRRVLKLDSMMIIAIHEEHIDNLTLLLKEVFPSEEIGKVVIVVNPAGASRDNHPRVHEYLAFVHRGNHRQCELLDNMFRQHCKTADTDPNCLVGVWAATSRGGPDSALRGHEGSTYPVLLDDKNQVVGIGPTYRQLTATTIEPWIMAIPEIADILAIIGNSPVEATSATALESVSINGLRAVWSRHSGTDNLGRWGLKPKEFMRRWNMGYVRSIIIKGGIVRIQHIGDSGMSAIMNGMIEILDRAVPVNGAENGTVLTMQRIQSGLVTPRSVWDRSRHYNNIGTGLMYDFLGRRSEFDFPKSLYAVVDPLLLAVQDNKNAVILDLFGGSGTTLHAVLLINKMDGGSRRCITITNNEVSPENRQSLYDKQIYIGSQTYKQKGIFYNTCMPRCVAAVTGRTSDGLLVGGKTRYYMDADRSDTFYTYLDNGKPLTVPFYYSDGFAANIHFFDLVYLDRKAVQAGDHYSEISPVLWLQAGAVGSFETSMNDAGYFIGARHAALHNLSNITLFRDAITPDIKRVWISDVSPRGFEQRRDMLPAHVLSHMLPRDYIKLFFS